MNSNFKSAFVLFLLSGIICLINLYGCSDKLKYEKYSSKSINLNLSLDYIAGWLYSEQIGANDNFPQVVFYKPSKKDAISLAGIIVTVDKSTKIQLPAQTIEAVAVDLLSKRQRFKDAKILLKLKRKFLGLPAWDIKLSYKTLDKTYSAEAKLIAVIERIIIFKREDKFYTLRYENRAEEFDQFSGAFSRIINSLRFKDRPR